MNFLRMLSHPLRCYRLLRRLANFHDTDEIYRFADEARELLTGSRERMTD